MVANFSSDDGILTGSPTYLNLWELVLESLYDDDNNIIEIDNNSQNEQQRISLQTTNLKINETQKKKKSYRTQEAIDRWNRIRRVNAFPRVLKRDIRRNYPLICVNTINSGDEKLYHRFFNKFFHPDCFWTISTGEGEPKILPIKGSIEHLKLYRICLEYIPDFSISLINSRIQREKQSNESKVILKLMYSGIITKCHSKDISLFQESISQIESETRNPNVEETNMKYFNFFHIMAELSSLDNCHLVSDEQFVILSQPRKFSFEAQITLHLNQKNCIIQLDEFINASTLSFNPL